jgi:hypothetical protein
MGEVLVDMDPAYIAHRITDAVEKSRESRKRLPEDYIEAAAMLKEIPDEEPPPIEAIPDLSTPVSYTEVEALLNHKSMHGWILSLEELQPFVEDWLRIIQNQPLETDEGVPNLGALQSRGRMTERIIDELGDQTLQERLTEQLRVQADILLVLGEKRHATIALRSAAGLEKNDAAADPFLRGLVGASMQLAVDLATEAAEEGEDEWMRSEKEGRDLWVPKPARDREDEEPTSQLWLPG